MPATTAFASRSQANTRRGLFQRGGVRIDDGSGLELVGPEHHLLARPAELLDARALDLLILDHEGAPGRPLAILPELDLAHDGAELVGPDVVGDLLLVEPLGPF